MKTGAARDSGEAPGGMPGTRLIELNLRDLDQLFNTLDPSPFHEKDLDEDAAKFILSWAQEFHASEPIKLVLHLEKPPEDASARLMVEEAIHHYFAYRLRLKRLDFKRLMKQGRSSLLVGLVFLGLCFAFLEIAALGKTSVMGGFFKEGLTIAGWVAMWRPLEIYLYEWWPIRRDQRVLEKLSRMKVEVRGKG